MRNSWEYVTFTALLIALMWQAATTELLCFKDTCSGKKLNVAASTGRQCCVDVEGYFFNFGRDSEACSKCEVVGWRNALVVARSGSQNNLSFGYIKGNAATTTSFKVSIDGDVENVTILTDLNRILLGIADRIVSIQVPRLKLGQTLSVNLTLTLLTQRSHNFFVSPETMTLRAGVPVIEFEDSQYSVNRSDAGNITLCLVFDEYATAAEFPVTVFITSGKADDGRIVSSEFGYSNTTNKTCQTLSLAVQDLDVKDDAVFFAYISLPAESLLELGAVGSASITLQGGRDEVNDDGGDGGKDGGGKDDGGKDGGGKDDGSTGNGEEIKPVETDKPDFSSVGDSSRSSDSSDDSWIIAVSVLVPSVLIAAVVAAVIGLVLYYRHTYIKKLTTS